MVMTSPLFENLDSRIRGITNVMAHVSKDKNRFRYDLYDIQSQKYLKAYRIRKDKAFSLDLYDTNAIVTPVEVPKDKNEFNQLLEDLKDLTMVYNKAEGEKAS